MLTKGRSLFYAKLLVRLCYIVASLVLMFFIKLHLGIQVLFFYTNMEVKVETKIMQNLNDTKINLIFILYYLAHNFLV